MEIPWEKMEQPLQGLPVDTANKVSVRREAIPLVFVPGIMGSRLRLAGSDGQGSNAQGLPNLRWDTDTGWLLGNLALRGAARRKALVIGDAFDPDYLEADFASPPADGERSVIRLYDPVLQALKNHPWGALEKVFSFPVYAFGYNWTGDTAEAGRKLAERITQIKSEEQARIGRCEKVILVTHSMGGLVARAACHLAGAEGDVLGIVHGVQPAAGSPAAYWRIKGGFEGGDLKSVATSYILGSNGRETTVILGNSIGGLQLLPNKHYVLNDGVSRGWLQAQGADGAALFKPKPEGGNPYAEIYAVPADVARPETGNPSGNAWWGLVDRDLLRPERPDDADGDAAILATMGEAVDVWTSYLGLLAKAEAFHDALGTYTHPKTYYFWGTGHATAETVRFEGTSNWVRSDPYATRSFRGFYRDRDGSDMQAVLQAPDGGGDGTVPASSGQFMGWKPADDPPPLPQALGVGHQGAYDDGAAQAFACSAIVALAALRYHAAKGG